MRGVAGRRKGFALPIVLWWLASLALVATQIVSLGRTTARVAVNVLGSAVAEAAADGAVNEAIYQLATHRWQADGAAHTRRDFQAVMSVRIDNEAEKVDPNVAPAGLIRALLQVCGAAPQRAAHLADAIVDWRSLDLRQVADGSRALPYRTAGLGYEPPHARFVSNDELGLVIGMTAELLACLGPHMSVYSLSVPSLQTTSDEVVRAALRDAYPEDLPPALGTPAQETTVVRITANARHTSGARFRRVAIVRFGSDLLHEDYLYKILAWGGEGG